jgi:hypothetical protein
LCTPSKDVSVCNTVMLTCVLCLLLPGGWCHGGVGPQKAAASDHPQGPQQVMAAQPQQLTVSC